ncbi:hypothetical protein GUJ93_ZPchr0006g45580 [Zizania palustris]|uniref:Uncharacterized protein n=1 Tax=Zizania palustris TaxID=103762 RepID=A0A8J5VLH9_ZIZPA|nr:hypothetical protein GUJ93_ZPchr0006g45580 [Zizania palustris]
MFLLSVLFLGSSCTAPAAAARLLADGTGGEVAAAAADGGAVLVVPTSLGWRLRHWLPAAVLEMKQGASSGASCSTWDPNNPCPPPPKH